MDILFILISILTITLLIVVHEFGHFLAAKYYGFQTPVFGIGLPFGPSIDLFKKWDTQFKFYWALIGGFVAIPELGDETDAETLEKYCVNKPLKEFPVYQRMVVASGGIVFNILFAFLLATVMAGSVGLPSAVATNTVSGFVDANHAAKDAGIQLGDKIVAINSTPVANGKELQKLIQESGKQELHLSIERPIVSDDKTETKFQTIELSLKSEGSLGIVLGHQKEYKKFAPNPLIWIWEAFKFTADTTIAMFISVIGLLSALVHKILALVIPNLAPMATELGEVKGIVGIVQLISHDIKSNGILLLEFAILLSLNLAVINVLPIPALDGGHLMFMAYEAITGKKPHGKVQETAIQIGFLFLLGIIALTTFNDIKNWIFG
jgi:membrane-associated protease RseP (regulator of RpoE activity)